MRFAGKAVAAVLLLLLCISPSAAAHPIISNTDVLIDVGHGGIDSGAMYGKLQEKDINLNIALKTYKFLTDKGYKVVLDRTGDYALSDDNKWLSIRSRNRKDLAQRAHLAAELKPRVVISLHVNVAKGSKRGPLVLFQKKNERSAVLADMIQKQLNAFYKMNELTRVGKPYYILNHVKCPAVIVEMGFITSAEDRKILVSPDGRKAIAASIAAGVEQYLWYEQFSPDKEKNKGK